MSRTTVTFMALAALSAIDLVRALVPALPVDVDSLRPGWNHRHVRLLGLPRLEAARGYEVVTYRGSGSGLLLNEILAVKPWLLIPLNRPRDDTATLVVAEVSLSEQGVPFDFDPNELEFEGLAGPVSAAIAAFTDVPANRVVRVQIGQRPRPWVAILFLVWAVIGVGWSQRITRSGVVVPGTAKVLMVGGLLLASWLAFERLRCSPLSNERAIVLLTLSVAALVLMVATMVFREPSQLAGPALSNEAYRAALEEQDRFLRGARVSPPDPVDFVRSPANQTDEPRS